MSLLSHGMCHNFGCIRPFYTKPAPFFRGDRGEARCCDGIGRAARLVYLIVLQLYCLCYGHQNIGHSEIGISPWVFGIRSRGRCHFKALELLFHLMCRDWMWRVQNGVELFDKKRVLLIWYETAIIMNWCKVLWHVTHTFVWIEHLLHYYKYHLWIDWWFILGHIYMTKCISKCITNRIRIWCCTPLLFANASNCGPPNSPTTSLSYMLLITFWFWWKLCDVFGRSMLHNAIVLNLLWPSCNLVLTLHARLAQR